MKRAVAVALVGVLATSGPGATDDTPKRPLVFSADVELVAVPVFVTTRDGKAVTGLTAADFQVEDEGRPVPVAALLAVDAADEGTFGTSPSVSAASRRQFLFLFDLSFSTPRGVQRARSAALRVLERDLEPGDLVSVAVFGPAGLDVLVGFTSDHRQASRAVATLAGGDGGSRLRDPLGLAFDLGYPFSDPTGAIGVGVNDDHGKAQVMMLTRIERDRYGQVVQSYVGELLRLSRHLDSVRGRKQVVLLSGGFDQSVLFGAEGTERTENNRSVAENRLWSVRSDRHFGSASARGSLNGLFESLDRTDTVVHTVPVEGMAPASSVEEVTSVPRASGRETLAQIASRSGGLFVRDTNDLEAGLRDVLAATRHYYVVAFAPSEARRKPGEVRRLRVSVRRADVTVSHRGGYTVADPSAAAPETRRLQAAEAIAKGLSGGTLRLRALAMPYRRADGRAALPVVLEIDGRSLTADAGGKPLSLDVYGYALDGQGRIQDAIGLTPTVDLGRAGAVVEGKGVQVLTAFRVREGPVDLRFLVRDGLGRSGSLRVKGTVPVFGAGDLVVSPPLVMDDPRRRVVIPMGSQGEPRLDIPFRLEDVAFTPETAPVLRRGEAREACVLTQGGSPGALGVQATLVDAQGGATPVLQGGTRLVADADGARRTVFSIRPPEGAAGDYLLRVTVNDPVTGQAKTTEVAVFVE